MATQFLDTTGDHKWSTAGNWSAGVPDSADAVTVGAAVTSLIIDATANCLSFDSTGTAGITISGNAALRVSGDFTLDANVTWTHNASLSLRTNPANFNSGGVSFSAINYIAIELGANVTLVTNNLNLGARVLYINGTGSSLVTNNLQIDCGLLSDGAAGTVTLTLGSSTINCTNVSFAAATLTVTSGTSAAITITNTGDFTADFGEADWHETTVVIAATGGKVVTIGDTAGTVSLDKLKISWSTNSVVSALVLSGGITLTNATADAFEVVGATVISRPMIRSSVVGTARHIHAETTDITNAVDFQDIHFDPHTVDLSAIASGNCGGNEGITFRTPANYYACTFTADRDITANIWSTADDGTADGTSVFPLPQDTIIFNDNSGNNTNRECGFLNFHRVGNINAVAGVLTESLIIKLYGCTCYGDLTCTGASLTFTTFGAGPTIDARVKGGNLSVNILPTVNTGAYTINSYGGTAQLAAALTHTGAFTHTRGTFDLNGNTLTTASYTGNASNTIVLQSSTSAGNIIVTGLTGTLFNMSGSGVTVSNAPHVQIGSSTQTLSADVTVAGGGKTYGNFTITKHAGNYSCILTGSNTFATFTCATPDATYQYSGVKFTAGTTTTVTSFVATGTASYTIPITSVTGSTHTLSDSTGTNTAQYCTISYSVAQGGATWATSNCTDGGNNTGWVFANALPAIMNFYRQLRRAA